MLIWEVVDTIQTFLNSPWGNIFQLLIGLALEVFFTVALFYWHPRAFVPTWIAIVLTALLALSSGHRGTALMFALLAILNLIEIPFLRFWYKSRMEAHAESQGHHGMPNANR